MQSIEASSKAEAKRWIMPASLGNSRPRVQPACETTAAPSSRIEKRSVPGLDALDELLHRRDEAVRVEGIGLEAEGGVAGEHEIVLDRTAMGDVLQSLLDAEAARIGEAP